MAITIFLIRKRLYILNQTSSNHELKQFKIRESQSGSSMDSEALAEFFLNDDRIKITQNLMSLKKISIMIIMIDPIQKLTRNIARNLIQDNIYYIKIQELEAEFFILYNDDFNKQVKLVTYMSKNVNDNQAQTHYQKWQAHSHQESYAILEYQYNQELQKSQFNDVLLEIY
ncbi:hypothetical protein ABPG72_014506 [Tetrahymena utriculariae]